MRYFIGLDKMTIDEIEVWRLLCRYSDYDTDIAGYTVSQLVTNADARLGLTTQKVRTMLKRFEKLGYIQPLTAGSKGKESTLKLTIKQQLFNNNETNKVKQLQQVQEIDSNNVTAIQQQTNNTTKKKKKENINTEAFTQIFELWNSKKIIVHKKQTDKIMKAYTKALKDYSHDEIVKAIENYSEVLESSFYYSHKFSLENFLKQANALSNFVDEGQMYINYLEHEQKNKTLAGTSANNKNFYNSSICNSTSNNTKGHEFI